jgi:hypothetical protein
MVLFLGVFAKSQKVTSTIVIPDCPSIRLEQLGYLWLDFHLIWCLRIFRKSVQKIKQGFGGEAWGKETSGETQA